MDSNPPLYCIWFESEAGEEIIVDRIRNLTSKEYPAISEFLCHLLVAAMTESTQYICKFTFRRAGCRFDALGRGERTTKFRVRIGHLPPFGFSISRADVADCFLRLLADENSVRKIVGGVSK